MSFVREFKDFLENEGMPRPLNGPSMALGTRESLKDYLDMIPPLQADAIEARLDGVCQTQLGRLLGISQSAMSTSLRAGIRRIHWLMARPKMSRLEALREIAGLLPPRHVWYARPIVYWLWSVYGLNWALRQTIGRAENPWPRKPGVARRHQGMASFLLRKILIPHASPRLRALLDWRARSGYVLADGATKGPKVRERPLLCLPIQAAEVPGLLAFYDKGWGALRMTTVYGMAPSSLHRALVRFSTSRRPGDSRGPSERKEEARRLKDEGLSWRAVGKALGVTHTTARQWVTGRPLQKPRRNAP